MAGVRVTTHRLGPARPAGCASPIRQAFLGGRVEDEPAAPRARGLGELLDVATQAYAAHFAPCIGVAAAVWLPFQVFSELLARSDLGLGSLVLLTAVTLPARFLCIGFVACFVIDRLLGREAGAGRALRRALGGAATLVQVAVAVTLATVLLFCMCVLPVVPGIWLLCLAPVVGVLERPSVLDSLRRSVSLALNWDFLGRWLGALLVSSGLFLPATLLLGAVHEAEVRSFLETSLGARGLGFDLAVAGVSAFFLALSGAFAGVVTTVLYVDARVRQEGLDLALQLERLVARRRAGPAPA